MSGKELFEGMSYVSDRFVDEAEHKMLPKSTSVTWMKWASMAACLCLVVASIFVAWDYLPFNQVSGDTAGNMAAGDVTGTASDGGLENYPVGGGEESETDEKAESLLQGVQYIRTNGGLEGSFSTNDIYPFTVIIHSVAELEQYYEDNCNFFDLERKDKVYADTTIGFLDTSDKYDAAYFAEHDLILLVLEEPSGSIRHEVKSVHYTSTGWVITVQHIVPEECTDDMAQWHLMLEIPKDQIK